MKTNTCAASQVLSVRRLPPPAVGCVPVSGWTLGRKGQQPVLMSGENMPAVVIA